MGSEEKNHATEQGNPAEGEGMRDEKYLDPKQNPFIIIGDDNIPVRPDDEEPGPISEDLEPLIPMGGYPEKKAEAEEKPEVEPGDFESKVKVFMDPVDEVIIVAPMGDKTLFKIAKRQCGALEVIEPDGSRRTLADLSAEEKKIVDYNLYTKCASGEGDCPCNRIYGPAE